MSVRTNRHCYHKNQITKNTSNIMQILSFITKPREFFESLKDQPPSLLRPAAIIGIMAICAAITGYQVGELTGRLLSGMMEGLGTITTIITAVSSFFGPWLLWALGTVIFLVMIKLVRQSCSFKRIAEITGYGAAPMILSSIAAIALNAYYLPMADIRPVISSDPEKVNAAVQAMLLDPAMQQLTTISTIISIIIMLWSANLWALGFEHCCGLEPRKALMVAGIPVLIYIVYTLANLFIFMPGAMA